MAMRGRFRAAANRASSPRVPNTKADEPQTAPPQPASFVSGRYEVKRFLGEGGKKRVYLAHDTQLDRDVAFALIKTEGLDDTARQRVTREAQAMGRLGDHQNIVSVAPLASDMPSLETAAIGEETEATSFLYSALAPLSHLAGVHSTNRAIGRLCGSAAKLLGKHGEARSHFNQAVGVCEQIRFRPELALTRLSLAELLLEHYPNERAEAIEHLDFAIREFREMKIQPSLERALRHRELLKA